MTMTGISAARKVTKTRPWMMIAAWRGTSQSFLQSPWVPVGGVSVRAELQETAAEDSGWVRRLVAIDGLARRAYSFQCWTASRGNGSWAGAHGRHGGEWLDAWWWFWIRSRRVLSVIRETNEMSEMKGFTTPFHAIEQPATRCVRSPAEESRSERSEG